MWLGGQPAAMACAYAVAISASAGLKQSSLQLSACFASQQSRAGGKAERLQVGATAGPSQCWQPLSPPRLSQRCPRDQSSLRLEAFAANGCQVDEYIDEDAGRRCESSSSANAHSPLSCSDHPVP